MHRLWTTIGLIGLMCAGCDNPKAASTAGEPGPKKQSEPRPEPRPPQMAAAPSADAAPPPQPAPNDDDPIPFDMVREKARAGASGRGNYDAGIITSPLSAALTVQEQLVFDVKIPKALEIFEGVNNRKPRSHQEFMAEIIGKGGIKLPPLPPRHRYVYDPKLGELMIERPVSAN